jgi:predicted secreted hydrolase
MILPSASFAQGYETFSVILRNGEELTGVRVRQDDEGFVLREASGREVRLGARAGAKCRTWKSVPHAGRFAGLDDS